MPTVALGSTTHKNTVDLLISNLTRLYLHSTKHFTKHHFKFYYTLRYTNSILITVNTNTNTLRRKITKLSNTLQTPGKLIKIKVIT